ncbi:hypothetical protein B0T10DRAFT_564993 [Thelonectria olida]|uniref:Uncharacterized protein n=1 Tax=Thelonectria olida TaxID=1576542 RepID=A0A9P8VY21_9HYPO|nr:hypothetical protein B0T10DRAFT_564993 [Thelonectria olida]
MFQVDFETGSNPQDVEAETDVASDFSLRTSPNAHCTPEEADTVSKADIVATSYAGSKFAAVSDLQRPKGLGVAINSVENGQRDTVSKSKVISSVPARQVDFAAVSEPDNVTKPDTVSETKLAINAKAEVSIDKSPSSPTAKVVPDEVGFKLGLDRMSVDEFIQMARDLVEHFAFDYNSTGTNPAIFDSFILWDGEAGPRWSKSDSELIDCITRADADRQKASLNYITTAIVFSREHQSRVRERSKTGLPRQTASETVTNELLGKGVGSLQMQRCRIKNMLTRGKRWSLIVQKLGCGILLMNEWSLSKSTTKVVHEFIERILGNPDKMARLRFLSDQVELMMDSGKTHPDQFHDQLIDETAEQLAANQIVVKENGFQLDVESLQSLEEGTSLTSAIYH